jgi:lipoprotein Spr
MILCLSVCACASVEDVTIIRGSLIIPSKQSDPSPPQRQAPQATIRNDNLPEDSSEEDSRTDMMYSDKLGTEFEGKENKSLIAAIEEWLGTRYQMGGCSKSGVDCSCFVKAVYQKVYGFDLERSSQDIFEQNLTRVDLDELKTGDLLFFKSKSGRIFHVGIYLSKNKFAHVSRIRGVKVSNLDYFKNTLFSAKRLNKNVANMD